MQPVKWSAGPCTGSPGPCTGSPGPCTGTLQKADALGPCAGSPRPCAGFFQISNGYNIAATLSFSMTTTAMSRPFLGLSAVCLP
ncbi:hypothetical protein HaLaN_24321 [Haematococcus lacustris]|uniref:Uncharacterized protein n=1 Tax=Haematococcus lacustris TaxID=44745 RepID=A0A6A0A4S3_HAELA|nr:hypothetical protein HaLaN_24321 [Haematococcus lacustris]